MKKLALPLTLMLGLWLGVSFVSFHVGRTSAAEDPVAQKLAIADARLDGEIAAMGWALDAITAAPPSYRTASQQTVTVRLPQLDSLIACEVQARGFVRSALTRGDSTIARNRRGLTGAALQPSLSGWRGADSSSVTVQSRCLGIAQAMRGVTPPPPDTTTPPPPPPDTVQPPPPPPPTDTTRGTVVASSDWSTTTGPTNAAWLDGQRFWQIAPSGQPPRSMEVVPCAALGWTATPNCMQVSMLGPNGNAFVQSNTVVPEGSYYLRFYVRVGPNTRAGTNHSVKLDYQSVQHVFWALHGATGTAYRPFFNVTNGNATGQKQFEPSAIPQGEWHRFEFFVDIYDPENRRFRVWPRVYNSAGALVLDSDDYANVGSGQSLTTYYGNGGYAQTTDLQLLRRLAMGNEGPAGSSNTGEKWWYAGVAVCTSWCGAR